MIFTKKATSAQRLRAVLGSLAILGSLKNHKQKKYVMKISWQSDLIYSTTGLAMLNTPVLSLTLKLGNIWSWQYLDGRPLGISWCYRHGFWSECLLEAHGQCQIQGSTSGCLVLAIFSGRASDTANTCKVKKSLKCRPLVLAGGTKAAAVKELFRRTIEDRFKRLKSVFRVDSFLWTQRSWTSLWNSPQRVHKWLFSTLHDTSFASLTVRKLLVIAKLVVCCCC